AVHPRDKVGNWLYGVAVQTARKARATRAKRWVREGRTPDADPPATDSPPDDLAGVIDAELNRLPDKYRTPIVLCELEGKTHGEAAEQLGWPIGTVSGRLSRAKALLADRLTRRGVTVTGGALAAALTPEAAAGLPAVALTPSPGVELLTREVLKAMRMTTLFTAIKFTAAAVVGCALVGVGLWPGGPRAEGKPPPDKTYRVTASDVLKEDDTVVTQIALDLPAGATVELANEQGKKGGFTFSAGDQKKADEPTRVTLTILADQVVPKKGAAAVVKFMIAYRLGKITGATSDTVPMPADAKTLADVLTVHTTSGDYKTGEATKLITFDGTTYTLRVTAAK
ncbi:MAG: sigma factor-like helix-turn-helix DNA-binding protein, partial [Gemmataceae bacterium]